jgi:protein-S-isoprenylcysteine O-methyltransferase Ste14
VAGVILLFQPYPHRFSVDSVVWQLGRAVQYGLVVVALLGFLFAWWARVYLGRLWSSAVGRKANHYLVDTGPYALVRHPIYTGVILATLVTAVMRGTVLAVTGAAIMMLGWYTKARLEEQYLRDELGADTYDAYARRVPMLVPFA